MTLPTPHTTYDAAMAPVRLVQLREAFEQAPARPGEYFVMTGGTTWLHVHLLHSQPSGMPTLTAYEQVPLAAACDTPDVTLTAEALRSLLRRHATGAPR